jgi:hypothetical protein
MSPAGATTLDCDVDSRQMIKKRLLPLSEKGGRRYEHQALHPRCGSISDRENPNERLPRTGDGLDDPTAACSCPIIKRLGLPFSGDRCPVLKDARAPFNFAPLGT